MNRKKIAILIPSAGKGTRSKLSYPKTLHRVRRVPILIRIIKKLSKYTDYFSLVINPSYEKEFSIIIEKYNTTIFVEEALHRLVEIHYHLGLEDEAKSYAAILGYNYNSSEWFKKSYKVFNKRYDDFKKEFKEKKKESIFKRILKIIE